MTWHNAVVIRSPSAVTMRLVNTFFEAEGLSGSFFRELLVARDFSKEPSLQSAYFYQLKRKISHGNSSDRLHSSHALLESVFFTADQAFFSVLNDVRERHFSALARPVFIDRSAVSCAEQIRVGLQQIISRE